MVEPIVIGISPYYFYDSYWGWRQIKPQQLVLSLGSWWIIDFVDSTVENAQNEVLSYD